MARVLVVEDEPRMRRLLEELLIAEGYEPAVAPDGVQGLAIATQSRIDVAVIDVGLPGMDGFELCRHLRKHEVNVGLLLLTARDSVDDRVAGLDAGADDYLTKPFAPTEFLARLRALLRRQQRMPGILAIGNLQLDPVAVRARCEGKVIALSVKEFSLLRVLVGNAGAVVPRDELLAEVWGPPTLFESSLVDQYVSYVRKKLGSSAASVTISTVRGVGYRLDEVG